MEPLPIDLAKGAGAVVEAAVAAPPVPVDNRVHNAGWRRRLVAALIDAVVFVPAVVALAFSLPAALALVVMAGVFTVWQLRVLQRRTGQTIGKNRVGISRVPGSGVVRRATPSTQHPPIDN